MNKKNKLSLTTSTYLILGLIAHTALAMSPKTEGAAQAAPQEKQFVCPVAGCGKSYTSKSSLRVHLQRHTEIRRFACTWPDCDQSFFTHAHLKDHYRLHTGERPYKCRYPGCNKRCVTSGNRSMHERTHDKSKQYRYKAKAGAESATEETSIDESSCSAAMEETSFGQAADFSEQPMPAAPPAVQYQVHVQGTLELQFFPVPPQPAGPPQNVQEKQFACQACDYTCTQRPDFIAHLEKHAKQNGTLVCHECLSVFFNRQGLAVHQHRHKKKATMQCPQPAPAPALSAPAPAPERPFSFVQTAMVEEPIQSPRQAERERQKNWALFVGTYPI